MTRIIRKLRRADGVFVRPKGGTFLIVEWVGLGGTSFYIRARNRAHADALYLELIESGDCVGVSLYVRGRFAGANDGHGS